MLSVSLARRLMASTSVAALALASTPGTTRAEVFTGSGPTSATIPVNYLVLDGYKSLVRFTNMTDIGPATRFPIVDRMEQFGFWIKGTSTFGSDILNQYDATIIARSDGLPEIVERHVTGLQRDAAVSIVNQGLISASSTRTRYLSQATGVLLNGSGAFTNTGTVQAFASEGGIAISFGVNSNVSTYLKNQGLITASAGRNTTLGQATAVALNGGGTLENFGELRATVSGGDEGRGVLIRGNGSLQNSGSILVLVQQSGYGSPSAQGVIAKDSSVSNSGKIAAEVFGTRRSASNLSASNLEALATGIVGFTLKNSGEVSASAHASALAVFYASGIQHNTASTKAYGASADSITNQGLIRAEASSDARHDAPAFWFDHGSATAVAEATGVDGARIDSAAKSTIEAKAAATSETWNHPSAVADAVGIKSEKSYVALNSFVSWINAGNLNVTSQANAHNSRSLIYQPASAESSAMGIEQTADTMIIRNSGEISVRSESKGYFDFVGEMELNSQAEATGISQLVNYAYLRDTELPQVISTNVGLLSISAVAVGEFSTAATVSAKAHGVLQEQGSEIASVVPGDLTTTNSGRISVLASASASTDQKTIGEAGVVDVRATGVTQLLNGPDNIGAVNNTGNITILSSGKDGATLEATSIGIDQGSKPPLWPVPFSHTAKVSNSGEIVVSSSGNGGTTDVTAIGMRQIPLSEATAENTGKVSVQAGSSATNAEAVARVVAVEQQALQDPLSRTFTVENTGSMTATGSAVGVGNARIDSLGVSQRARNLATDNAGTIVSESSAAARGALTVYYDVIVDAGDALAEASSSGMYQRFHGSKAHVQVMGNSGSVTAAAESRAFSSFSATAKAVASAVGAHQDTAGGTGSSADLRLINTGTLSGDATAISPGSPISVDRVKGLVTATATGALQDASEQDAAKVYLENAGTVMAVASGSVGVSVTGTYKSATGLVAAQATGVSQEVSGVSADLANRGNISAISNAVARTMFQGETTALAYGVNQSGRANAFLYNTGAISAGANAATASPTDGYATARAAGVKQSLDSGSPFQSVNNIGSISAAVTATAIGQDSIAVGEARGVDVQGFSLLPLAIVNIKGAQINSMADSTAGSIANAFANGIYVAASTVEGSITNYGTISVSAKATSTDAADGGISRAIGIYDPSGTNNLKIVNAGTIAVYAEANTESGATAIKIMTDEEGAGQRQSRLASAPAALALGPQTTVINDNGVLYAGYSDDGGKTVKRGVAIDATLAPNPVKVVLAGGVILGDIELSSDDKLTMTESTQILGNVDAAGSELAIGNGKKLTWLVGTEQNKAENFFGLPVFSDTAPTTMTLGSFKVEAGSTLNLRGLNADTTSLPSVDATTASLDGTLAVDFGPGLFKDVTTYNDLITASTIDGAFSNVIDNSVLLDLAASNDGNSIDLSVTRVAFDGVGGLTGNQHSVAESIEGVYPAVTEDSDFGQLVGHMFTLDSGDYSAFLDQLTGAEYAQHLQALLWSTRPVQNLITDRMECFGGTSIYAASPDTADAGNGGNAAGKSEGCFVPEQGSVWMRGYGVWNTLDGDDNAPGYSERQVGVLVGGDYSFDGNWFAGAAVGYRSGDMDFNNWGGRPGATIDYSGFQVAAYGGYDDGASYARAALSYGYNYDGDSHRMIQFDSSLVDPSGDFTSSVWSVYGEAGHRFDLADEFRVTPFVGLSYAGAHLDGFTESDPEGTGAALEVQGATATSLATRLGVRLAKDFQLSPGVLTPVLSLGWEHEFMDTRQKLDMSFADAPSGADFEVSGSKSPRDSLWVDAGARFVGDDRVGVGLFYTGIVNEDYASHGATLRFSFNF